jgi:hypothetical protein
MYRLRDAHLSGQLDHVCDHVLLRRHASRQVTSAEIGVPLASGPMYVINDYAASPTYGGPTTGNVNMQVLSFTP